MVIVSASNPIYAHCSSPSPRAFHDRRIFSDGKVLLQPTRNSYDNTLVLYHGKHHGPQSR